MQIHGISNLQVRSFAGNFTDNGFIIKLGLECKQLQADGQFKADVKFGGLRLVPKGPFNITLGKFIEREFFEKIYEFYEKLMINSKIFFRQRTCYRFNGWQFC